MPPKGDIWRYEEIAAPSSTPASSDMLRRGTIGLYGRPVQHRGPGSDRSDLLERGARVAGAAEPKRRGNEQKQAEGSGDRPSSPRSDNVVLSQAEKDNVLSIESPGGTSRLIYRGAIKEFLESDYNLLGPDGNPRNPLNILNEANLSNLRSGRKQAAEGGL